MSFRKPVFPGEEVTARVLVKELYPEKHRVLLETVCLDANQQVLIEGTALVKLP
jgi:acyl dehydratase